MTFHDSSVSLGLCIAKRILNMRFITYARPRFHSWPGNEMRLKNSTYLLFSPFSLLRRDGRVKENSKKILKKEVNGKTGKNAPRVYEQ